MNTISKYAGTHLFVRSSFTLLKGTLSIEALVDLAKTAGYKALALTDHNVLHGVPEFIRLCQKEQLKALIGMECDIRFDEKVYPFVLIAKNTKGYQALIRYSSQISITKEAIDLETLRNDHANLHVIALNRFGPFEEACYNQNNEQLVLIAKRLIENVPNFYLGLSYQEDAFWKQQNSKLKSMFLPLGIKTLALPKVYYAKADDEMLYRILTGIEKGQTLSDGSLTVEAYRYLLDPLELNALYEPDDVSRTDELAQQCEPIQVPSSTYLPHFDCPKGITTQQYLTQLCLNGLKKRLNETIPNAYKQRLKHELDVIFSMHYEDYFLIVWDFIRFARSKDIYVGPGRGSAAGSLVSYCLGITHVDPLEYNLLFERFLNPDRISMPDIDTDFPDNRRDEVLAYVLEKYGHEHVAHISTFGTLAAKQVLRDVGKVMELNPRDLDSLSKSIPSMPKMTLELAYAQSSSFKQLIDSNDRFKELYRYALQLEGLPRHISTHAAGIVMSSVALTEVVPLIQIESDMASTQYTMEHLESLGLIKMDFLGLRNLTIIDEVVKNIQKTQADFNILKLPTNDEVTLNLIRNVDTVGVFQLESEGMKNLLRRMQAQSFDDIVATIALFRPGPMENIPVYLEARQNPKSVHYLHSDLKPILESTYGILIYQEQIMQVAQVMAGFTLAKADVLRKAMSKKNSNDLEALKHDFIKGCESKGYSLTLAEEVFSLIMKFANYGFNKSHSVAYAMISYQMAYLKANYPLFFFEALFNSVIGAETKTYEYVSEAKSHGVTVLGPNINRSDLSYTIEGNSIRFPLMVIKGVGTVGVNEIMSAREKGPFISFHDFVVRTLSRKVTKGTLESLIDAGALDEFDISRASLRASLDDALEYAQMVKIDDQNSTIMDLNILKPLPLIDVQDVYIERSEREKAVLGFYLSDHPLSRVKRHYQSNIRLDAILPKSQNQSFICMVKKIKTHRTKNGQMMAFLVVYDEFSEFDVVVMPNLYQSILTQLKNQSMIRVEGLIEKEGSCLAKRIEFIELDSSNF